MTGFNKGAFARLVAARLGVTQAEGLLLYEEIGQSMDASLTAGDTVFLFGNGTLKVVKKRGELYDTRVRYRPSTREAEKGTTTALHGMAGVAGGVVVDAIVVSSYSAGERALHVGRACTARSYDETDEVVIYRGDDGGFRCVHRVIGGRTEESIVRTKRAAKEWLRANFPATDAGSAPG